MTPPLRYQWLAPTVWLSNRLSFSRKYLLIGAVVLLALASLSVPLLQQTRAQSQSAGQEREGLRQFGAQATALTELVAWRSRAIADPLARPPQTLGQALEALAADARERGLREQAGRLLLNWSQAGGLEGADTQQRFAAQTASVNALLNLISDTARLNRLKVDHELDASFDMLSTRLPQVIDTLAKQQDVFAIASAEMTSYALGAQVVLSESVPGLRAGVAQLVGIRPQAQPLQALLSALLDGILAQQDAADKALDKPEAQQELKALSEANLRLAKELLLGVAHQADAHLQQRLDGLARTRFVVGALLISAIAAISYLFAGIYSSTLRSLKLLSRGTDAFCGGRLDTRIELETQDELVLVARNFNTVAAEFQHLLHLIKEQNESRQRELEALVQERTAELADRNERLRAAGEQVAEELALARNMQLAILPQDFPEEATWGVCASMHPARELGGDFYDCFSLPDGRYGVLVADVSGKGVGAAFFMAVSRTVLLDLAMSGASPAQVFEQANTLLCERNPVELFVTACYAIFNPVDGSLVYASAGHHPPLLRQPDGQVVPLPCASEVALGVLPDLPYTDRQAHLAPGGALLLYTDGVTEAFSASDEAYGDARLHHWLSATSPGTDARRMVASLEADVAHFVDGAEPSDDLTCLVLCRKQGVSPMDMTPVDIGPKTRLLDYQLPSQLAEIGKLATAVEEALPDRPDLAFSANLCLEELITNTIQHGLKGEPDRSIQITMNRSEQWLEIILSDDAPPFDPFAEAPAPDLDLDVDERPIGGLGVHIVKTVMDEAHAYSSGNGNLIVLLKTLRQAEA